MEWWSSVSGSECICISSLTEYIKLRCTRPHWGAKRFESRILVGSNIEAIKWADATILAVVVPQVDERFKHLIPSM